MDPQIVDSPDYASEIIPALQEFPSLSLTINPDDFYGPNGICKTRKVKESYGNARSRLS